jgi:hypothetical protein
MESEASVFRCLGPRPQLLNSEAFSGIRRASEKMRRSYDRCIREIHPYMVDGVT